MIAVVSILPAPARAAYEESCTTFWFTLGAGVGSDPRRSDLCDGHGGFAQTYRLTTSAGAGSFARFQLVATSREADTVAHLNCAFLGGIVIDCGTSGLFTAVLDFQFTMPSAGGTIELWGEDLAVPPVAGARFGGFCFELRTPPRDSLNC